MRRGRAGGRSRLCYTHGQAEHPGNPAVHLPLCQAMPVQPDGKIGQNTLDRSGVLLD